MSNVVASAAAIREAMKNRGVNVNVEDKHAVEIIPLAPCDFCGRDDFTNASGRSIHINHCHLNPKKQSYASTVCGKCGVAVANQGYPAHFRKCEGDAEETLRIQAINADLKKRRAKAKKTGKPIQSFRGKHHVVEITETANGKKKAKVVRKGRQKTAAANTPKISSASKSQVDSSFDNMVSVMANHFAPVMGTRYQEFLDWVQETRKVWDSV